MRFKKFNAGVQPMQEAIMEGDKISGYKTVWNQDRPLCFDYNMVSDKFGIILESGTQEADVEQPRLKKETKENYIPFDEDNGDAPF